MITDVLGVLIAFVSVMLLLSMFVTGLVQGTQAALRLRARNLLVGVAAILESKDRIEAGKEETGDRAGLRPRMRGEYRKEAAKLLNRSGIASVDRVKDGRENAWWRILLGPKVSWVHMDDLRAALVPKSGTSKVEKTKPVSSDETDEASAEEGVADKDVSLGPERRDSRPVDEAEGEAKQAPKIPSELDRAINNFEPALKKRFRLFIRLWTIFWSLIVAASFQVSAPRLFSAFGSGEIPVEPALDSAEELLAFAATSVIDPRYELTAPVALDRLAERFPNQADLIAEIGIIEGTKDDQINEIRGVFANSVDRDLIVNEYADLLDALVSGEDEPEPAEPREITDRLEAFDIRFWKDEWDFYFETDGAIIWEAVLGVLLTTILLSFGAPFWFEQLRNLAALRDLRAPPSPSHASAASGRSGEA